MIVQTLSVCMAGLLTFGGLAAADQADFGPYGCASVDDDAACGGVAVSVFGDATTEPAGGLYEPSGALSVFRYARGGDVAVAPTGSASTPGGVAVAFGGAEGWWALGVAYSARGTWAVSAAGDADGRFLAVSGLGAAHARDCAFLRHATATVPCAAVSGLGRAEGPVALGACNLYGPACV